MPDDLRTRIAAEIWNSTQLRGVKTQGMRGITMADAEFLADAVIRELYGILVDWGLWLAEEITGRQMTRLDMESCLTDWKADDE